MNIKIDRELLLTPLGNVSGIVEKRHALPILSNLLLEGSQGKLKFTATDLEMQISTHIKTELLDDFQITISAKKLFDITRALPENCKIDFQIEENKVTVKAKKSRFNLQTLPPQDYPVMKKEENEAIELKLPQKEFKALLKQVDFAMAQQDIRYYLNGLLIEVKEKNINIVGTDGHRLSFTSLELTTPTNPAQVIIPRKTVVELVKLLSDTDDPLEISFSNNQVNFKFNDIDLITKVIDGKFPDYSRVIPEGHENSFNINRALLLESMLRASILSNDKYRGIRMVIEENNLKLVSNNSEQEQAEEELEIDYKGQKIDIGFNVTYLIDVLMNIHSDELTIAFNDSSSSCLVTIPSNKKYKYVVMPMRI